MNVYINKNEKTWEVACGTSKEDAASAMTWFFRQSISPEELEIADRSFVDNYIHPQMLECGTVYIGYYDLASKAFSYPEIDAWEIAFGQRHPVCHVVAPPQRWAGFDYYERDEIKQALLFKYGTLNGYVDEHYIEGLKVLAEEIEEAAKTLNKKLYDPFDDDGNPVDFTDDSLPF
jgi:hypothetical protein